MRKGRLQVLCRHVEEAVMSLVFEIDEPPHGVGGVLATRLDQLEKAFGVVVILTPRAATECLAAGGIGGGDSCQDEECGRRARPVGIGIVVISVGRPL